MARTKAKLTLEDIATHANVSVSTVSRVINNSGPVSRDLEVRVKEAMKELGIAKPRPDIIACIVPEFMNPANTQIITGVQEEAEKMGLHLLILPVSEKPGSLHYNLALLKHIVVDGVILVHLGIDPEEIFELFTRTDIPIVVLNRTMCSTQVHCIDTNRENGMYQAAKFLINLNHREIAYISRSSESELSKARLRGVQRALEEAGFPLKPEFYRESLSTIDDGFRVATNLLRFPPENRPTAILAFNDQVAIGVLHAVRAAGLSVPEDLSVVGFDDMPLASHTNPPLTTVAQPQYQKGELAVQKLFHSLGGYDTDKEGSTLLECSLVVRESTGPCKTKS
jgi:DNA-binding LacI/PurR family transcriptional regulator